MLHTAFVAILLKKSHHFTPKTISTDSEQKARDNKVPMAQEGLITGREAVPSRPWQEWGVPPQPPPPQLCHRCEGDGDVRLVSLL